MNSAQEGFAITYIEKMLSGSRSELRNPIIARVLYYRKAVETWGRGLKLIFDECGKAGLHNPQVTSNEGYTKIVFYRPGNGKTDPVSDPVTGPVSDPVTDPVIVSENMQIEKQVVRMLTVLSNGPMTAGELREALSIKHRKFFRDNYLNPAIRLGLVLPEKDVSIHNPGLRYFITDKGLSAMKLHHEKTL